MAETPEQMAMYIPIVAIVMGIGVAFWAIYWNHRNKQMEYEERRAMIEKGMTPPEVLIDDVRHIKHLTPEDYFRRGLIMTFLGAGLIIARFFVLSDDGQVQTAWALGVAGSIVGMIGLGNLVYFFLRKDHIQEEHRP